MSSSNAAGAALRRHWALIALFAMDRNGTSPSDTLLGLDAMFAEDPPSPSPSEATALHRIERFEDHLLGPARWASIRADVGEVLERVALNLATLDGHIRTASTRWRIDRMPPIDRSILRMGVAEYLFRSPARPRDTIHGCIELAKRFGESGTPRFVNGILDQVRRNLELPFR